MSEIRLDANTILSSVPGSFPSQLLANGGTTPQKLSDPGADGTYGILEASGTRTWQELASVAVSGQAGDVANSVFSRSYATEIASATAAGSYSLVDANYNFTVPAAYNVPGAVIESDLVFTLTGAGASKGDGVIQIVAGSGGSLGGYAFDDSSTLGVYVMTTRICVFSGQRYGINRVLLSNNTLLDTTVTGAFAAIGNGADLAVGVYWSEGTPTFTASFQHFSLRVFPATTAAS